MSFQLRQSFYRLHRRRANRTGLSLLSAVAVAIASNFITGAITPDIAQAQQLDPQLRGSFLADPLTADPRDPLLPEKPDDRPFSPLEIREIETNLTQLDRMARQQLIVGETDEAFELWRREVQLSRALSAVRPEAEIQTIQRVAALAWREQQRVDVQLLTLRSREIWAEVTENGPANDVTLTALAEIFTTLRDIDAVVGVYQQRIEQQEAASRDATAQKIDLAELHLSWFQFAEAADLYLALLSQAKEKGAIAPQIQYLERLVYSYQQANSLTNAVRAQTELLALYQTQAQTPDAAEKLPGLLVAIAQNYRTLNRINLAIDYYRSAYSAAQRLQQFSLSARVLQDLGSLYQSVALDAEALKAYELLIPVEQQAYNDYGVMTAYDNIGQIQRRQGNRFEALKAFQQGLAIADRLNLRQGYFIEQIESVTPNSPLLPTSPNP